MQKSEQNLQQNEFKNSNTSFNLKNTALNWLKAVQILYWVKNILIVFLK